MARIQGWYLFKSSEISPIWKGDSLRISPSIEHDLQIKFAPNLSCECSRDLGILTTFLLRWGVCDRRLALQAPEARPATIKGSPVLYESLKLDSAEESPKIPLSPLRPSSPQAPVTLPPPSHCFAAIAVVGFTSPHSSALCHMMSSYSSWLKSWS